MNILDIAIAKQLAGGGGGSGTDNYNDLSNLPKINDTTLSGNKSSSALGLQSEITSDSKLDSDLISDVDQDNKFVTSAEKNTWNAKQNAIDADHKISADYVDDSTSTNKFVTSSDKEAWNAKQSAIDSSHKLSSDLVDDTNHTNKFVTSTEKQTWNAKQNAIDSDHKLSSSLVSFDSEEASALASGIDSAKVSQISTNQTNILYTLGKTGKNLFEFTVNGLKQRWDNGTWNGNTFTSNFGVTIVVNDNKSIVVTGTPTSQTSLTLGIYDHTLYKGCIYSGGTSDVSTTTCISGVNNIGYDYGDGVTMTGDTDRAIQIAFFTGTNLNITFKPMICTADDWAVGHDFAPYALPNSDLTQGLAELNAHPFLTVPFNHNMVYRGKNLGDTLTDAQHTALSGGNFTDLYLGDYWTKTVTIPAGTYTGGDSTEVTVPAQTNITLKAVIADFDTFYAGYASTYAGINTHHAAVIVTGFSNVVWNGTNSTAGGYVNSLIHKWLVGSALPQIETWFGSAKVLSHQKLLTNAITGDAASGWAWSSQKISLLSENQMYGSKVWGNSKASNGGYEPGEAFKHLNVFNHIDANLLFGNKNIWLRDIASAEWSACLSSGGSADSIGASHARVAPAALILLS